jgi:hypothetical protein
MYADSTALEPYSFRERMDEAKDAAATRDLSRPLRRVKERRGPLIDYWPVPVVADVLGVSHARVKFLAARGRFGKAKRSKTGKGRPWLIPVHWQPDGTYRLELRTGSRGLKTLYERTFYPPAPF